MVTVCYFSTLNSRLLDLIPGEQSENVYENKGQGQNVVISSARRLRDNPLIQGVLGVTVETPRQGMLFRAIRAEGSRLESVEGCSTSATSPEISHRWRSFTRRARKLFMARQLRQTRQSPRLLQSSPATREDKKGD